MRLQLTFTPSPSSKSLDAASEHVISVCTTLHTCLKYSSIPPYKTLDTNELVGHTLRRIVGGAFSPKLAKKLARLVSMETNLMLSLETVAKERKEVAVCSKEKISHSSSTDELFLATIVRLG